MKFFKWKTFYQYVLKKHLTEFYSFKYDLINLQVKGKETVHQKPIVNIKVWKKSQHWFENSVENN